jgi:hypothetical protein
MQHHEQELLLVEGINELPTIPHIGSIGTCSRNVIIDEHLADHRHTRKEAKSLRL